jgi:hypothetical protein
MAKTISAQSAPRTLTLTDNVLLIHHSMADLRKSLNGYLAIEQLARLAPSGDSDCDDAPPPIEIDRAVLCELLYALYDGVSSKLDHLADLATTARSQVLPDAPAL